MTVFVLLASILLQGCAAGPFQLQYLKQSEAGLSYYTDKTSAVVYPVETNDHTTDPVLFNAPRHIRTPEEAEPRNISLNECIRLALADTTVILDDQSFGSPGNAVLSRPNQAPSYLDSAIQNTGFLFGGRSVEAALSDFDALATSSVTWGRNEAPQNNSNLGLRAGQTLVTETMAWQSRLEKPLATGGNVSLSGEVNYDGNNRPTGDFLQQFASNYNGLVQAEYRQPLLATGGVAYNRIAGPASQGLRGVSGVAQGVMISRINNDISLTQFEQSVSLLVRDVEKSYWDLEHALRLYDSERQALQELVDHRQLLILRRVRSILIKQTDCDILEAGGRIRGSLADVLAAESRLRRLCHLPLNDDTFLYPNDKPIVARLDPSWEASLQEALANRVELRRQKWEIKSLELQLIAARNLTRPQLDFVSRYRRNGLGDKFLGGGNTFGNDVFNGQNEGWDIGFQFIMPVGFRLARVRERNHELRLRKSKAVLGEMEREIALELSAAMLEMQRWYELGDSMPQRIECEKEYLEEAKILVRRQAESSMVEDALSRKLQAHHGIRDAEQAYMRSVIEYNKAITDLKFRRGTLLVDNEIYLAEGNWHPAAAPFALQRAEARTHAKDAHKLRTVPMEFGGPPAAEAWEALDLNTRPSFPGALQGDVGEPLYGPPQSVPDIPADVPTPKVIPPAPLVPPARDSETLPIPQPSDNDIITEHLRSLRAMQRGTQLAPVAGDADFPDDTAGRVRL